MEYVDHEDDLHRNLDREACRCSLMKNESIQMQCFISASGRRSFRHSWHKLIRSTTSTLSSSTSLLGSVGRVRCAKTLLFFTMRWPKKTARASTSLFGDLRCPEIRILSPKRLLGFCLHYYVTFNGQRISVSFRKDSLGYRLAIWPA